MKALWVLVAKSSCDSAIAAELSAAIAGLHQRNSKTKSPPTALAV